MKNISIKKIVSTFSGTCFLFLIMTKSTCASHAIGGEITYTHVQGLTYQINITLYTHVPTPQNGNVDRPVLDSVHIGDGVVMSFTRDSFVDFPNDIRVNHYGEIHTFISPGSYHIYFVDPNRAGNICNIPNSFFIPFSIESELIISASMCPNSSVSFADKPIFFGQHNKLYSQNVAAINLDHDSISFEFVPNLGENAMPIPGYVFPPNFIIDSISGQITSVGIPDTICKWGFAIKVSDWKNGILAGYVIRDYLLEILPDTDSTYFYSPNGNLFTFTGPAGFPISSSFYYVDNSGAGVSVYGEAYSSNNSPSTSFTNGLTDTVFQVTSWTPDFFRPRPSPYIFVYRGGNGTRQIDFTVLITVTGPPYDSCYSSPHINVPEIDGIGNSLGVFPNPASDHLVLKTLAKNHDALFVTIYNSIGKLIFQKQFPADANGMISIDAKNFPEGFYLVKVEGDKYKSTAKVCIVRE